jgi:TolB protein
MIGLRPLAAALALLPIAASAQEAVTVVAVPILAAPTRVVTPAGETGVIARQIAEVIAADLRTSGDLVPVGPDKLRVYSYPEATAPDFRQWRSSTGAKGLVTGFVQARDQSRLTVGCYVYDLNGGRELGRQGFSVAPAEWRRAAHRCADLAYSKISGRAGWFDARIAYVAESGPATARIKRIAVMDSDGSNHRFLTAGETTVLTPRLAPAGDRVAYVSFTGGTPHVRVADTTGENDRPLLPGAGGMSFAPRFSPDGSTLLISIAANGNTDIYSVEASGGAARRLTATPGTDTSASFSPDGSRIVFESDRSGTPQLYVMGADGSGARRISFGTGRYGSPVWSPDGDLIAFTRAGPDGLRIGVMSATGTNERLLTAGPADEAPSWSASGRHILFYRSAGAGGRASLHLVSADGGKPRPLVTPLGASDPHWSGGAKK